MKRGMIAGVSVAAAVAASATLVTGTATATRGGQAAADPVRGPYFAVLDGKKEVDPTTGRTGAGDPQGRGAASVLLDINTHTLCYTISVKNIGRPIAAHIHVGAPGRAGPIFVPLTPPATGHWGVSSGCVTVTDQVLNALRFHPRGYYVNVHTNAYPEGAVRGNLFSHSEP